MISVIVPCFNQGPFLEECLKSLLSQTYADWECIIVNDGSTDNSEEVALYYCKLDSRFRYFNKQNGGLSSARNTGIKSATGKYIQLLDSDDTLHPLKFEKQLELFDEKTELVVSDYFPFDNTLGTFVSKRYLTPFINSTSYPNTELILNWEDKLSIPCHCVLFKKELLTRGSYLLFDESLANHEDWVFWVKLFERSKGFKNLRIALANYRIHDHSMCNDKVSMKAGFLKACQSLEEYFRETGNQQFLTACSKKRRNLENKPEARLSGLYKFLKLFIPPIFYKVRRIV